MSKKITKIIEYMLDFLILCIAIIIIIAIYYLIQTKVLNNDYANIFGYTFFEVGTGSMSPTIEVGDIVIVKITKEVERNDIIVYKEGKNLITHRIVEKNEIDLVTKGDANNTKDKPIVKEQVVGEVIKIFPKVGIWKKTIFTPEILILIIIAIVFFGIAFSYRGNERKKDD